MDAPSLDFESAPSAVFPCSMDVRATEPNPLAIRLRAARREMGCLLYLPQGNMILVDVDELFHVEQDMA